MGSSGYQDLIRPEIINTVSGLALISKIVVEGFTSGLNRSRSVGPGMEFSQYRGYEPGDDLRLLDWKMLARSGRYYIKQSEIESQLTVTCIVDASASMNHREEKLSKMEFTRVLIATLAYMAHKQGDAVGLAALNAMHLVHVVPKADTKQYHRLLLELLRIDPKGKWPNAAISRKRIPNRGAKELLFVFTDMYEQEAELSTFIKNLKTAKNEVVVMQILGSAEITFNYEKNIVFEDLETGTRVKVDAKSAREGYLNRMKNKMELVKQDFLSKGIEHHVFQMDAHLGEALTLFLKQRKKFN